MTHRLAIVLSHPVQYYSPWFRHLAARTELQLKVFYLWDFGVMETEDWTFQKSFTWDVPLLDGYEHEFVANRSANPGTHHFLGLDNPAAVAAISQWHPDTILFFGYNFATHLRLILSPKLHSVPMWFRGDSHELYPARGWKSAVARKLRHLLFRRFVRFLAVGKANTEYFRRSGVTEEKITVVPHCVDNGRFRESAADANAAAAVWKREVGISEDAIVVLFAGKFEEKKRPLDLVYAFRSLGSNLPRRFPAATLLFVGSGPLESELRVAAGEQLDKTVFFAHFQNQSQMPKVYAAGDVIVLPSFGRGETWGLAINEAFNLGIPAIVSSHVGCGPDLVIEGKTGWVFPAGNVEALGECLAKAVADRDKLRQMGMSACEHIAQFSYEVATQALITALPPDL